MEADCKDSSSANMALAENVDITKLFATLSSQMTAQNYSIQEHIKWNRGLVKPKRHHPVSKGFCAMNGKCSTVCFP
jgi:hypothetical protein